MFNSFYTWMPWEKDEKFKSMIKHRSHQLFHSVKNGASWRRLVHTMFEEESKCTQVDSK